jgi:hypothetical protein
MCVGFGAAAFAVSPPALQPVVFSDIAGHEAEGALSLLGALGIYTGDSGLGGAVKPDDPVTRAQFCKIIVTALGRGTTAAGLAGLQPAFTDGATIPTWAWGYINVAVYMGVIKGYADGSFGAGNPVTYAEAVTMLIRSVPGHLAQVTPGVWPYNFLFYAVDTGFTGGVEVGFANLPASRGDIARMTVGTLQLNDLNKDGGPIGTPDLVVYTDVVTAYDATTVTYATPPSSPLNLAAKYWIVGAANLEGVRNLTVDYVLNSTGVFFMGVAVVSNVVSGVFSSLADTNSDAVLDTIVLADGTKVGYSTPVSVTLNGAAGSTETNLAAGDELVIVTGPTGKAVNVQATNFAEMDYISAFAKSTSTPTDTHFHSFHLGWQTDIPAACKVYLNGALSDRDMLAVNDAILVAFAGANPANAPIIIKAKRELAEGTVTGTTESYPGPVYRVMMDLKAGGSKTYIVNTHFGLAAGMAPYLAKFAVDFNGQPFLNIAYATLTPYAVCKSFVIDGVSGAMTGTFDVKGTSVIYKSTVNLAAFIGNYLTLTINTGTNTVTGFTVVDVLTNEYTIKALDTVNGTMTLENGGTFYFVNNTTLVVYKAGGTYIGMAGLKIGDILHYNQVDWIFELHTP